MTIFVLVATLVQSAVGVSLVLGWLGRRRPMAGTVLAHVGGSVLALATWIAFFVTGAVLWGWLSLAAMTFGNTYGDKVLLARGQRATGVQGNKLALYRATVPAIFRGRFPRRVAFHALFAGVVYFGALAACVVASV